MILKKKQIALFLLLLLSLGFTNLAYMGVVKADGGYEPTTLNGSQNRNFPDIGHSILGFTVKTIGDFGENPRIHFSLQEIFNDPYVRYLRIYIDEVKIWETTFATSVNGHYSKVIDAPQLKWQNDESLDVHEILIEIFWGANEDGEYNTPSYRLDYLQLSKLIFEQIEIAGFYEPKTLIDSQNRNFPDIGHSILGFTIKTNKSYLGESPQIHFSLQEIFYDPYPRYLRIYIDDVKVWETTFATSVNGHYSKVIDVPQLMWKSPIYYDETVNVHDILIEIFWGANEDGQYNTPSYKLEYAQLSKITFEQIEVEGFYEPKTLIGSQNRNFPDIGHSILGFTIRTNKSYLGEFPRIHFSIQEIFYDQYYRYLRIYVDQVKIWETTFNPSVNGHYSNVIDIPQLMWKPPVYYKEYLNVHEILIEIFWGANEDGQYNTPSYKLEYFQLSKITYQQNIAEIRNNVLYCYTPIKSNLYGSDEDDASINFNCYHEAGLDGNFSHTTPDIRSCAIATLDPDRDYYDEITILIWKLWVQYYYYVHEFSMQWRILLSNGNYLTYDYLNQILSVDVSTEADNILDEINIIYEYILPYVPLKYPLGPVLRSSKYLYQTPQVTEGHDTSYDYWAKWTNSIVPTLLGDAPAVFTKEGVSMRVYWESAIPNQYNGPIQIEVSWNMVLYKFYEAWNGFTLTRTQYVETTDPIILTGNYYFALEYYPPPLP